MGLHAHVTELVCLFVFVFKQRFKSGIHACKANTPSTVSCPQSLRTASNQWNHDSDPTLAVSMLYPFISYLLIRDKVPVTLFSPLRAINDMHLKFLCCPPLSPSLFGVLALSPDWQVQYCWATPSAVLLGRLLSLDSCLLVLHWLPSSALEGGRKEDWLVLSRPGQVWEQV